MDQTYASEIQLVRVTTDDGERRVWLAATPRNKAVARVLDVIPEGWTASLLKNKLSSKDVADLRMKPGDVREVASPPQRP